MTEVGNAGIGAALRAAREQSGVTLRQIADATKLSVRTLHALEQERVDQLPGGIYRRAIVRAHAAHVGLDPEKTLRTFLVKYPDDVPTMADLIPQQSATPSRGRLQALIGFIGAAFPVLVGVLYFSLSVTGSDAPRHVADVMAPRPVGPQWTPAVTSAALTPPVGDAPVAMMVSVSAPTRLQIVADGREVVAQAFDPGAVVRVDVGSDVVLIGDDAGAVHFSINGRAGRTLGHAGAPLTAHISRDDYEGWLIHP